MTHALPLFVLAGLTLAGPALAQESPAQDDIVIVGNRGAARAATASPVPVDVYSGADLAARGMSDLPHALQFIAPSFNYPRSATAPSSANTRPATLRGLAPDQLLVLVNGKRWHGSSVINFNNVIGRGAVPVDLATIPLAAVERIEVLRDGAGAQYGSDAIAGVINVVLKSAGSGGSVTVQSGLTSEGDGAVHIATLNKGFRLGDRGSVNATLELRTHAPTNRAAIDSRYNRVTAEAGDPDSLDANAVINAKYDFGAAELYGDLVYDHRRSTNAPQFRVPGTSVLYPQGFVPHIEVNMDDAGGTLGLRGTVSGWNWDISDTVGYNDAQFRAKDTANASLGASSPTRFDAGGSSYFQNVANLTVSRPFDLLAGANLALGAEHRHEHYDIRKGEPASFFGGGAQGFPGFNPPTPVHLGRNSESAFLDAEIKPVSALSIDGAVRYEHYSDFGSTVTYKVSGLFKATPFLAFRASTGTGFRAPALQQVGFSTVTGQQSGTAIVNVGTFAVNDPVAKALGATPLRREKSRNYGAGLILTPARNFSLTADYFHIAIKDRIALSETLSGAAVLAVLNAAGITNASQARFFTNALDTTTEGVEVTANWRWQVATGIRLTLDAGYARTTTHVDRLAQNSVIRTLPLLATTTIDLLTTAQPKDKVIGSAQLDTGIFRLNLSATRFGSFKAFSVLQEQVFSPVTTVDITGEARVAPHFTLGVGVLNAGNAYPDKIVDRALSQGGSYQYPEIGALGTNGREYYVRASVTF